MPPVLPQVFLDRPIAHRGLHDAAAGRPENSRAAVAAAIDGGYGIEIDIQPSRDGVAMVFHDDDLRRLTGQEGPVRARTAADLGCLALLGTGETVPRLSEILALVAGRAPLLIEVKDQDGGLGERVGPLEAAVARDLAGYEGPVALMSFNPESVAALADLLPGIPRGLTTCGFRPEDWPTVGDARRAVLSAMPDLERVGAAFISHDHRDLDSPHVARAAAAGLPILTWTIRSPADEIRARRIAANVTFEGYRPA